MKLFLSLALLTASAFASNTQVKVVYGEDDRKDVYETTNPLFLRLARSTAAMIPVGNLRADGERIQVAGPSMRSRGFCASERFSDQPTAANCSGFLVGEKLLVTAGHCMTRAAQCSGNRWVFDYKMENAGSTNISVPASSVYSCARVITQRLEGGNGDDFALIELDRPVVDRAPLAYRKSGRPSVGDDIVVIGHPTGLPTKVADGASVRRLSDKFFVANLDTYGGNSGSAVFNATTGVVEGILVRGEEDYVQDTTNWCRATNYCPDTGCRGEDVTYITNIRELL